MRHQLPRLLSPGKSCSLVSGLFKFGVLPPPRRNFVNVLKKLRNTDARMAFYSRLVDEVYGDWAQTYELCSAMVLAIQANSNKKGSLEEAGNVKDGAEVHVDEGIVVGADKGDDESDDQGDDEGVGEVVDEGADIYEGLPVIADDSSLTKRSLEPLSDYVEPLVMKRIADTYGTFITFTDPLIEDPDLNGMVDQAFKVLSNQCAIIWDLLGYGTKIKRKCNQHRLKFYRRMTFYQLVTLSRVRNNQNFVAWSLIAAAVAYGLADKEACWRIPIFFGHACAYKTLFEKTRSLRNLTWFYDRVRSTLATQRFAYLDRHGSTHEPNVMMAVFDNSQQNQSFTFQRGGASSNFVKCTARLFMKLWQGTWVETPLPVDRVHLKVGFDA